MNEERKHPLRLVFEAREGGVVSEDTPLRLAFEASD